MKILICGAGIAGLATAWCLRRDGHTVTVLERNPRLRDEGYMLDFMGSGVDACERLGLLPDLARLHYPIDRLVFADRRGRPRVSVSYPVLRSRLFHDRHFNFMRGDVERLLYEKNGGVGSVRFGSTVASFEQRERSVRVTLDDGAVERADLLVGADGIHSQVRRLAFGDDALFVRPMGYVAAAFIVDEAAAAHGPERALLTVTAPNRQVSVYPTPDGRAATLFLHKVSGGHAMESACAELRRIYGDLGGTVPELLDRCTRAPNVYLDAVAQVEMNTWSRGRVSLVGDACQCVSPFAGQGASMAFAAAYVLAEALRTAPSVEQALTRYDARVKPAIVRQQRAGRRMARWFVPAGPISLALRNLVMRASSWPVVAAVLRRRMAAGSIFA